LVRRTLPVKVRDAVDGHELPVEAVRPAKVETFTLGTGVGEVTVRLNAEQQRQAVATSLKVPVEIYLHRRKVDEHLVEVKLAERRAAEPVQDIPQPRLGLLLPPSMQSQCRYRVVIEPGSELALEPIQVRGAPTAVADYMRERYHLVLEVEEKDTREPPGTTISRPLRYYVPVSYQQRITIVHPQQRLIRFHLEPIDAEQVD